MAKKKKNKETKKTERVKDRKEILMFDAVSPNTYNFQAVESYLNATQVNPMLIGVQLGKLYGFIEARALDFQHAEEIKSSLNNILNIYIEAGTFNGVKKIVPFKFRYISENERKQIVEDFKRTLKIKKQKNTTSTYMG